ncbi:MAG: L-threonylcarbamoyladenylate synthase [Phocaeicola sp.]|nr:threonylcarbamoyl-AMP synthase [Phocaeicola sp.]MDD7448408.1 L-threonylcarbamoyladenylate synthase [Prevotellaceae bacterium]MDY3913704.1 L-threonylcarbamoyladenylate synthase [Phocaeicola sp.]MDY5938350.1 L-threonylcarbamoyladenylate synthase [Phocaeicola sp.]
MMANIKDEVKRACEVLATGGVILYPTDTIWGIGCDATNEKAVQRVYEIKKRMDSKALLVLVDHDLKLSYYLQEVPAVAYDLIDYSTKPLTIIYDKARNLAPNLLAEDGSVGIRITQETFSKELCFRFRKAIVSTSANISGTPSPTCFADISPEIKEAVDYIVDYRQNEKAGAKPSSIIKLGIGGEVKIIRE